MNNGTAQGQRGENGGHKKTARTKRATSPTTRRTGGGYVTMDVMEVQNQNQMSNELRVENENMEQPDQTLPTSSSLSLFSSSLLPPTNSWVGSPSSKLPFTFSRTANKHFTQKQQWPQYDGTKDLGCAFTHRPLFLKFQKQQLQAEHEEKNKNIVLRHKEMKQKQRGALAAAIAMTENNLPTEVDHEISLLFQQISNKLFIAWKDRRGQMMNYPSICNGLSSGKSKGRRSRNDQNDRDSSYLSETDLYSSLLAVGIELNGNEFVMFCRVLLPTNSNGEYKTSKVCDLLMSGRKLLAEEEKNDTNVKEANVDRGGTSKSRRPMSPHQGTVIDV